MKLFNLKKIKTVVMVGMALGMANTAIASDSSLTLKWRYQNADSGTMVKDQVRTEISSGNYVSHEKIEKTLFLVKLAKALRKNINDFEKACKTPVHPPVYRLMGDGNDTADSAVILIPEEFKNRCIKERAAVSEKLLSEIAKLDRTLQENYSLLADEKVLEVMDLGRKLAKNMKDREIYVPHPVPPMPRPVPMPHPVPYPMPGPCDPSTGCISVRMDMAASMSGLNVTGGGAQDINSFRKMVGDGIIPSSQSLPVEGFLSEFDLSIGDGFCNELICFTPAISSNNSKLYLQIGMGSNVTKDMFKRNPLNLSIVLDISGSMSATDNTEKSRLEWAKEAIRHVVHEMNAEDYLSVVIFDTDSEIFINTANVENSEKIIQKVNTLKTRGSTNLEKGLRNGYELVSENFMPGYENRVILISDAGLNTGVTKDADLLKLVSDYSGEKIGLTAVGLGLNFNQDFIHQVTKSQGGNYVFVNSGKQMLKLVKNFDYLVTPVAYNLKASVSFDGMDAKLVKAYGVPMNEDESVKDLIDIRTLFFSENGGAIVLEYDISK